MFVLPSTPVRQTRTSSWQRYIKPDINTPSSPSSRLHQQQSFHTIQQEQQRLHSHTNQLLSPPSSASISTSNTSQSNSYSSPPSIQLQTPITHHTHTQTQRTSPPPTLCYSSPMQATYPNTPSPQAPYGINGGIIVNEQSNIMPHSSSTATTECGPLMPTQPDVFLSYSHSNTMAKTQRPALRPSLSHNAMVKTASTPSPSLWPRRVMTAGSAITGVTTSTSSERDTMRPFTSNSLVAASPAFAAPPPPASSQGALPISIPSSNTNNSQVATSDLSGSTPRVVEREASVGMGGENNNDSRNRQHPLQPISDHQGQHQNTHTHEANTPFLPPPPPSTSSNTTLTHAPHNPHPHSSSSSTTSSYPHNCHHYSSSSYPPSYTPYHPVHHYLDGNNQQAPYTNASTTNTPAYGTPITPYDSYSQSSPWPMSTSITHHPEAHPHHQPQQLAYHWGMHHMAMPAKQDEPILAPGELPAPRPPMSYAALIGEALLFAPPPHQLYVSEISDSIKKRYPYYRQNPTKIYNGVRHQTSMCKAFVKLPRPFGDQSGGARKWAIRAGCEGWFAGGGYHPPTMTMAGSGKNRIGGKAKATARAKQLVIGTGDDKSRMFPSNYPSSDSPGDGPSCGPAYDGTSRPYMPFNQQPNFSTPHPPFSNLAPGYHYIPAPLASGHSQANQPYYVPVWGPYGQHNSSFGSHNSTSHLPSQGSVSPEQSGWRSLAETRSSEDTHVGSSYEEVKMIHAMGSPAGSNHSYQGSIHSSHVASPDTM